MPTRDFIPSIPIETEVYTSSAGPLFPELNASKEGLAPPRVFSSMDIVAYAVLPSKKVYKLGSLSMLSISSHRDKFPVTSLGSIAVRGFCSGHRTCLKEDTLIETLNGPIEIKDVTPGTKVLSYNVAGYKEYANCTNNYDMGIKDCLSLKLDSGLEITLTKDHLVYTTVGWKEAGNIEEGDHVIIPTEYQDNEELNLPDYYIKFLAYGLGDGIFGKVGDKETYYCFTPGKSDTSIIEDIEKECSQNNIGYGKRLNSGGGSFTIRLHNCKRRCGWQVREYEPFILWTRSLDIYGKYSFNKSVPQCIFSASKRQIKLFLSCLLATDGSLKERNILQPELGLRFRYVTTSEKLVSDIYRLLLKVGIKSTITKTALKDLPANKKYPNIVHKHNRYTLEIAQEYMYKFLTTIPVVGKKEIQDLYIPKEKKKILYLYSDLKEYLSLNKLNLKKKFPGVFPSINSNLVSSERVKDKAPEIYDDFVLTYTPSSYKETSTVKVLSVSPAGKHRVYDLSVEKNHNFFAPILVHNCGGTLVFNTYDRNVWYRLVEGRSEYPLRQINYIMPDELPAFDITITLVNENGDVAFTGLHGVTILDEGETMSVDNIAIMESYSYMAVSKIPLQPYNAGLLFEQLNSGLPSVPLTQLPSSLSSTQVPA